MLSFRGIGEVIWIIFQYVCMFLPGPCRMDIVCPGVIDPTLPENQWSCVDVQYDTVLVGNTGCIIFKAQMGGGSPCQLSNLPLPRIVVSYKHVQTVRTANTSVTCIHVELRHNSTVMHVLYSYLINRSRI